MSARNARPAHDPGLGRQVQGVEQGLGGGPQPGLEHLGHHHRGPGVLLPQGAELVAGEAEGLHPFEGHDRRRTDRPLVDQGLLAERIPGSHDVDGDHVADRAVDPDRHRADVDEVDAVPRFSLVADERTLRVALAVAAGQDGPPIHVRQGVQQLPRHCGSSRVGGDRRVTRRRHHIPGNGRKLPVPRDPDGTAPHTPSVGTVTLPVSPGRQTGRARTRTLSVHGQQGRWSQMAYLEMVLSVVVALVALVALALAASARPVSHLHSDHQDGGGRHYPPARPWSWVQPTGPGRDVSGRHPGNRHLSTRYGSTGRCRRPSDGSSAAAGRPRRSAAHARAVTPAD